MSRKLDTNALNAVEALVEENRVLKARIADLGMEDTARLDWAEQNRIYVRHLVWGDEFAFEIDAKSLLNPVEGQTLREALDTAMREALDSPHPKH